MYNTSDINDCISLNILYLLKYAKRIRHKLNKLMKSSPDCISIDSDYEGVASLSNSSVYNNVNSNDNLLRIVCLNCCGIKTRLQYPEFRNLIQSYNIVCFVETKTDDIDIITLPAYKFVMKNRKTITKNVRVVSW